MTKKQLRAIKRYSSYRTFYYYGLYQECLQELHAALTEGHWVVDDLWWDYTENTTAAYYWTGTGDIGWGKLG